MSTRPTFRICRPGDVLSVGGVDVRYVEGTPDGAVLLEVKPPSDTRVVRAADLVRYAPAPEDVS